MAVWLFGPSVRSLFREMCLGTCLVDVQDLLALWRGIVPVPAPLCRAACQIYLLYADHFAQIVGYAGEQILDFGAA